MKVVLVHGFFSELKREKVSWAPAFASVCSLATDKMWAVACALAAMISPPRWTVSQTVKYFVTSMDRVTNRSPTERQSVYLGSYSLIFWMRHNSREVSDFCWGICLWEDLFSKWKVLEKCRARDDAPSAPMSQSLALDDGIEEAKVQTQDTLLCGWLMAYSEDKHTDPHIWRPSPSCLEGSEQVDFNTFSFQQGSTFAFSIERRKITKWATSQS